MLVTFKTATYSDITMFGSAAVALLKLMGQSGGVPGAIMPADVPEALTNLEAGLTVDSTETPGSENESADKDDDDEPAPISLATRAQPLVELLRSAREAGDNVVWEE